MHRFADFSNISSETLRQGTWICSNETNSSAHVANIRYTDLKLVF